MTGKYEYPEAIGMTTQEQYKGSYLPGDDPVRTIHVTDDIERQLFQVASSALQGILANPSINPLNKEGYEQIAISAGSVAYVLLSVLNLSHRILQGYEIERIFEKAE